jgi:opacity protein-like surface antigen
MNKLIAGLVLLAMPMLGFSQNYWEVTLNPGGLVYFGDLTVPDVTFKETHLAGQISIKRYFHGEHALRFSALYGTISGADRNYDRNSIRDNSFVSSLAELSLMGELDLKGRKRYTKKLGYQRIISPYVMVGLSAVYCKPDVTYGQPDSPDKAINYPDWHLGIPFGGGVKFDINERVFFGMELGLRLTLSDYLDGTQASGNAYKNDAFAFSSIMAGYRFQKKRKVAMMEKA